MRSEWSADLKVFLYLIVGHLMGHPVGLRGTARRQKHAVDSYIKSMADMKIGFRAYERHVKVRKVAKAYNKGSVKLEVSVVAGSSAEIVFDILTETLVQQGCRALPGQAPPGYFEDQVQELPESIKEGDDF